MISGMTHKDRAFDFSDFNVTNAFKNCSFTKDNKDTGEVCDGTQVQTILRIQKGTYLTIIRYFRWFGMIIVYIVIP